MEDAHRFIMGILGLGAALVLTLSLAGYADESALRAALIPVALYGLGQLFVGRS